MNNEKMRFIEVSFLVVYVAMWLIVNVIEIVFLFNSISVLHPTRHVRSFECSFLQGALFHVAEENWRHYEHVDC